MTISGKLRHSDLEGGGIWLLDANGTSYELENLPKEFQKDGASVELEGEVQEQGFSIGMMGAIFKVTQARAR